MKRKTLIADSGKTALAKAALPMAACAALLLLGACGGGGGNGDAVGADDEAAADMLPEDFMPEGYRSCTIELAMPHPLDEGREMRISAECFRAPGMRKDGAARMAVDGAGEGFGIAESEGAWKHLGSFRNNYLDGLSIECPNGTGYGSASMDIRDLAISFAGRSEDAASGALELSGTIVAGQLQARGGTTFNGVPLPLAGRPVRVRYGR